MQRLEVSFAVRRIYTSLGAKGLTTLNNVVSSTSDKYVCQFLSAEKNKILFTIVTNIWSFIHILKFF